MMVPEAQALFAILENAHSQVYLGVKALHEKVAACHDMVELTELAWTLKQSHKYADDMRKELERTQKTCERLACLLWTKTDGGPIRSPSCTATPRVKMMASLPHRERDPEAYAALMSYLKIPPELWGDKDNYDVVRVHWPGFVDYLTEKIENGEPTPPGIDVTKTYPVYGLTMRGKRGSAKV